MTARNEKTFWFDSSDLGTGAHETRVFGRFEDGQLDLWLENEKSIGFTDLSERDKAQVQEILHLTWRERFQIAQEELQIVKTLKEATQHLSSLGEPTGHYERVILNAERKAK